LPASRRDSTTWPALRAGAAADGDGADNDSFDIRKMSMEEIEALPELGQCTGGDEGRPPMVEELMAEDVRFGMKMRALRGDFAPEDPRLDTESGRALAETIMPFPGMVEIRVVVKSMDSQDIVPELVELVNGVAGVKVMTHTSTERLNGKYVTLDLQCAMESAEARETAFEVLGSHRNVAMKF